MKSRHYLIPAFSLAAALVSAIAWAHGGPPAAGGAVGNLGVGASSAGAFGGSAHGAVGASGGGAFSNGALGGSFGTAETIGMRQERSRAQANATQPNNADTQASVMGEARGRSVATLAAGGASASRDTAAMVHAIQAQAMASRETLLAELHARVDASAKAMAEVRKSGAKLDGDAKANFAAAAADMKAKEKALKKSMKAAEKADADAWIDARAKLATDFDAFASAVARAEAASRVEAKSAEKPKS